MSEPTVCAVMLTANRAEMAPRAVACFRAQTYPNKRLLIYDTSLKLADMDWHQDTPNESLIPAYPTGRTIGELRNCAAQNIPSAAFGSEVIIHWDSDDWSHPNRISEQVALLQTSGAQAVGYREMLFWRESRCKECGDYANTNCDEQGSDPHPGEAWLYSNGNPSYACGTSLCYWRKTWEAKPFPALPRPDDARGEDTEWLKGLKSVGVSANHDVFDSRHKPWYPRMIARIHAGNTSPNYRPELMRASEKQGGEWRRVPEWDNYCYGQMEFPLSNTAWYLPK